MVSEQAQRGLDTIFTKAAKANLLLDRTGDMIDISPLPVHLAPEKSGTIEEQLFVLTIASYLFRLTTIFHLPTNKASEAYFTRNGEGSKLIEVFSELGNMCCGAMNRELGDHFMHLGMSTPVVLDSACTQFLNELKASHVSRHTISINNTVHINATLSLRAYSALDFRVDADAPEEETGTIELF